MEEKRGCRGDAWCKNRRLFVMKHRIHVPNRHARFWARAPSPTPSPTDPVPAGPRTAGRLRTRHLAVPCWSTGHARHQASVRLPDPHPCPRPRQLPRQKGERRASASGKTTPERSGRCAAPCSAQTHDRTMSSREYDARARLLRKQRGGPGHRQENDPLGYSSALAVC